jgi:hypothetical protein
VEDLGVLRLDERRNRSTEREPEILTLGGGPVALVGGGMDGAELVQLSEVVLAGDDLGLAERSDDNGEQ